MSYEGRCLNLCVCVCEYNHADIVYARDYAAHAKSHHSCTPTHTHTLAADTPDFYLEHKSIAYFVE